MAKKSYKKKQFNKKKYNNKQIVKNNMSDNFRCSPNKVTFMSNSMLPLPPRYRCKLHSAIIAYEAAGVASGHYSIRLNGAYLPWDTAGTDLPNANPAVATTNFAGYTQLCNLNTYARCRVFGSKITVEMMPQSILDGVILTITPSDSVSAPATSAIAQAQPFTKTCTVYSGKGKTSLTNYCSQSKLLGVSSRAIQDDLSGNFAHLYNTAPAVPLYWNINWAVPDTVVSAQPMEMRVRLTHYVEFYSLQNDTIVQT